MINNLFSNVILIENYPKTCLNIVVDIYEFNCELLHYIAMGLSVAICSANIEQKGIISCANVIYKNGKVIVDPNLDEEENYDFKLIFGSLIDLQENNLYIQNGQINETEYKKVRVMLNKR